MDRLISRLAALLIVMFVAAGLWRVSITPIVVKPPGGVPGLGARAECGHDWSDSARVDVVADIIDVPEFHDCQRFIVREGASYRYDSLFAVFASQGLDTIEAALGVPRQPPVVIPPGGLPGARDTTPRGIQLLRFSMTVRAVPAAVVYAEAQYDSLGIKYRINCLYVWRVADPEGDLDGQRWFARMVSRGYEKTCPYAAVGELPALGAGTNLTVSRTRAPGFSSRKDYPAVARWDWDDAHAKQYSESRAAPRGARYTTPTWSLLPRCGLPTMIRRRSNAYASSRDGTISSTSPR